MRERSQRPGGDESFLSGRAVCSQQGAPEERPVRGPSPGAQPPRGAEKGAPLSHRSRVVSSVPQSLLKTWAQSRDSVSASSGRERNGKENWGRGRSLGAEIRLLYAGTDLTQETQL